MESFLQINDGKCVWQQPKTSHVEEYTLPINPGNAKALMVIWQLLTCVSCGDDPSVAFRQAPEYYRLDHILSYRFAPAWLSWDEGVSSAINNFVFLLTFFHDFYDNESCLFERLFSPTASR